MYNFFIKSENLIENSVKLDGKDFFHAKNVLRMKEKDTFLVSIDNKNYLCEIKEIFSDYLIAEVIEKDFFDTSLNIEIYLFQGLPKSDKLELIIQKAVELGVKEIIPVQMERCVAKIENNKIKVKTERYQAIAESAAKQCKRAFIPVVSTPLSLNQAIEKAKDLDLFLVPYENEQGIKSTINALSKIQKGFKVGVLIGPEGGFSDSEIALAKTVGESISLGKRILRTETASITALSMLMLHAEMNF